MTICVDSRSKTPMATSCFSAVLELRWLEARARACRKNRLQRTATIKCHGTKVSGLNRNVSWLKGGIE